MDQNTEEKLALIEKFEAKLEQLHAHALQARDASQSALEYISNVRSELNALQLEILKKGDKS